MSEHDMGATIARLRKEKGLTQEQLGEKIYQTKNAVSKWERNDGIPDIKNIMALSEFFGVTVDYLLTGRKEEAHVESELELCVKNDNTELARTLYNKKDKFGKTVYDYALKYERREILVDIINNNYTLFDNLNIEKYSERISELLPCDAERAFAEKARRTNRFTGIPSDIISVKSEDLEKYSFPAVLRYLYDNRESLSDAQKSYYFGYGDSATIWGGAFPYFITRAYDDKNRELFEKFVTAYAKAGGAADDLRKLLPLIIKTYEEDRPAFEKLVSLFDGKSLNLKNDENFAVFVKEVYLKDGREWGDRLNSLGGKIYGEDDIRCFLIEGDDSKSKARKIEEKCVYKGFLWLDKLVGCDLKYVKKLLKKYPVSLSEVVAKHLVDGNIKDIFRLAVDLGLNDIAKCCTDYVTYGDVDTAEYDRYKEKASFLYSVFDKAMTARPAGDEILAGLFTGNAAMTGEYVPLSNCRLGYYAFELPAEEVDGYLAGRCKTCLEIMEDFKEKLLEKLSAPEESAPEISDGISREMIDGLIAKGDTEAVVTKLCTKIEICLRNRGYEGTLFEQIGGYCDSIGQSSKRAKILHRLRKVRNSQLHPEKTEKPLTDSEIKSCVETVFEIAEEK